jgi:hypothetical protein
LGFTKRKTRNEALLVLSLIRLSTLNKHKHSPKRINLLINFLVYITLFVKSQEKNKRIFQGQNGTLALLVAAIMVTTNVLDEWDKMAHLGVTQ